MTHILTTIEEYDDCGIFRISEAFTKNTRDNITLHAFNRQQHNEYTRGMIYYLVYKHERIHECNCYMSGK
jgi:hypothetical protein